MRTTTTSACDLFHRCLTHRASDDWREFIQRYDRRVRGTVGRALARSWDRPVEQDLDDFVQELYCRLLAAGARRFRGRTEAELWAYLARAASRLVADHRRAVHAEKRRQDAWVPSWQPSPPDPEERLLFRDRMRWFFQRCRRAAGGFRTPIKMRMMRLAFLEGRSSQEIARVLGNRLTPARVDGTICRMRQRLARDGIRVPQRRIAGLC